MKLRNEFLAATLTLGLVSAPDAAAECLFPDTLTASVGLVINTSGARVDAPGAAQLKEGNDTCFLYSVTATVKITENNTINFTETHTRVGEVVFTLSAPASIESCYSSSIDASGGSLTATGSGGSACWYGPPLPPPEDPPEEPPQCPTSPILIDLDANGYHLAGIGEAVLFDIDADGRAEAISWTAAGEEDSFLALDRNGNGAIDDGAELFGTATPLMNGDRASNGYEALAVFDSPAAGGNADGLISDADSVWPSLWLWTDRDHDGISETGELVPADEGDLESIGLSFRESRHTDAHGNVFRYRGRASMRAPGANRVTQTYDVFFVLKK